MRNWEFVPQVHKITDMKKHLQDARDQYLNLWVDLEEMTYQISEDAPAGWRKVNGRVENGWKKEDR